MSQIKIKRGAIGYNPGTRDVDGHAHGARSGHTRYVVAFCAADGSYGGVGAVGSRRQCFKAMRGATAPGVVMTVRRPRAYDKPIAA